MRHKTSWSLAVALFLISHLAYSGEKVDCGPKMLNPTRDHVTPHIAWQTPSAGGSLKVTYLSYQIGLREIVELAQRFDIQYNVITVANPEMSDRFANWGSAFSSVTTVTEDDLFLMAESKIEEPCDLILVGNIDWAALSPETRYRILKKVKEGIPLLGVIANPDDYLKRAMSDKVPCPDWSFLYPFNGLPAYSKYKYKNLKDMIQGRMEVYRFGKGLIVLLTNIPLTKHVLPTQRITPVDNPGIGASNVEYEYYLALIGHLMNRLAAHDPAVRITGADHVKRSRDDSSPLSFLVESDRRTEMNCRMVLRNAYNETFRSAERKLKFADGKAAVDFDLARGVPAGNYFADLWVTDENGKVADFGSAFIVVSSDSFIEKINIKSDFTEQEPVAGVIVLADKLDRSDLILRIRNRDNFNRVTSARDIPVEGRKEVEFKFDKIKPLTVVQCVEAELDGGNETLDMKKKPYTISNLPMKDDVHYLFQWRSSVPCYLAGRVYEQMYQAGADICFAGWAIGAANANIRLIPDVMRQYDRKTDWYPHPDIPKRGMDDHVRLPCLLDSNYLKKVEMRLDRNALELKPYSPAGFDIGDECHFVARAPYELCFCSNCVSAFHAVLKNEYRTVDDMNREYGSKYGSFEEVQPVTLDDAKKDMRLIPLWVDYRRHMESVWAGLFTYCQDTIRKTIPGAKVGYEGSDTEVNSYRAADFYKLSQSITCNGVYDGAFVPHAVKDFISPESILGLGWYGAYNPDRSEAFQRYISWRHLFRGANTFFVWSATPSQIWEIGYSVMAPDFSYYDFFKANIQEVGEIKSGIGKMLLSSKRCDDHTAILYSASSVHAATFTDGLPSSKEVLNALITLLEDTGSQFRIVSYKQVADGILRSDGYRYLILPYAQALSASESKEIDAFVKEGGYVIADLRPGVRDEHGKALPQGSLDHVFGVRQTTGKPDVRKGGVKLMAEGFPADLPETCADASLCLTTGTARGEVNKAPAMIVNTYGKGRAILLNFSLSGYARVEGGLENSSVAGGKDAIPIGTFWKSLKAHVGMPEKVRIAAQNPSGLRIYRYGYGSLVYMGVLQDLPEAEIQYALQKAKPLEAAPVELTLDGKVHVYDTRAGKYLGYTDKISITVKPGIAHLYSFLPYGVKAISVKMPGSVQRGQNLNYKISISAKGGDVGRHVIRRTLVAPDGGEVTYYSENQVAEKGKLEGGIPLAFNERQGKWKIKFKDIASGVEATKTFIVEDAK